VGAVEFPARCHERRDIARTPRLFWFAQVGEDDEWDEAVGVGHVLDQLVALPAFEQLWRPELGGRVVLIYEDLGLLPLRLAGQDRAIAAGDGSDARRSSGWRHAKMPCTSGALMRTSPSAASQVTL